MPLNAIPVHGCHVLLEQVLTLVTLVTPVSPQVLLTRVQAVNKLYDFGVGALGIENHKLLVSLQASES